MIAKTNIAPGQPKSTAKIRLKTRLKTEG